MRDFDYKKYINLNISAKKYDMIAGIYEYKGKQELYVRNFSYGLDKMVEVIKIRCDECSLGTLISPD